MKPFGIRNRILLAALAPALLVAVLISGIFLVGQIEQVQRDRALRLASLVQHLTDNAGFGIFSDNRPALRRVIEHALADPDVVGAIILNARAEVLASSVGEGARPDRGTVIDGLPDAIEFSGIPRWYGVPITPDTLGNEDLFAPSDGSGTPIGQLLLKISDQGYSITLKQRLVVALGSTLLILAFGGLLAYLLSQRLISTFTDIGRLMEQVGQEAVTPQINVVGNDELGDLARRINAMASAVSNTQEDLQLRVVEATVALRSERDAAARAAESRSRFFASASHDLRQPVQALDLQLARLLREADDTPMRAQLEPIALSINHLRYLLDSLLDYSRLSGGVFSVTLQPVSSRDILATLRATFAAPAAEKGLQLRVRSRDCWLLTDRALLHRVLINLVGNAIRHTRRGGILIACRKTATHAHLEIWDTGPGIPLGNQDAIFDELVQLDNPERDLAKGLGLGLAIVRRTTDLLGHPLRLRSRPGHGSCFSITLPLVAAPDELSGSAEPAPTALLISPSQPDWLEIEFSLREWGHSCVHVADEGDAVRWLARHASPALLVCDTGGDVAASLARLDRIDAAAGDPLPALLVHPGPHPAVNTGNPRRQFLARPFRPARLRALVDFLVSEEEAEEEETQ